MDFAYEYAKMMVHTKFEDLSPHVVEITKRFILDTIGVAAAGRNRIESQKAIQLVREWGGKEEASILFSNTRLPAVHAAFANSVMIHALDFDDTHDGAVVHAFTTNFPAALSVSERMGPVSGKDFILALNLGVDLACRLGLAVGSAPDFSKKTVHFIRTAVCGGFGACAVAAKLMNFNTEEIVNALGIVLSQVGGTRQVVIDNAMTKRFQPAFSAKAGISSAMLGDLGISGCRDVFEGRYGFFSSYWGGDYSREELTAGLGTRFEMENLSFKPYPCCRYNHGAIEAVLVCAKKNAVTADTIKQVTVHLPAQKYFDAVSRPFSIGNNPVMDAQFSIPYSIAAALLDGYVFLDSYEVSKIKNPKRRELAEKVAVLTDIPVVDRKSMGPVTVEIHTQDNQFFSHTVSDILGSPQKPLSRDDCIKKMKRCFEYGAHPAGEGELNGLIERIFKLEMDNDVATLVNDINVLRGGCNGNIGK